MRKNATQSSKLTGGPSFAVDGVMDFPHAESCTAMDTTSKVSWWQVDLANVFMVYYVTVTSCEDCSGDKLKSFQVYVSEQPYSSTNMSVEQQCASISKLDGFGKGLTINITCGAYLEGQFVFVVAEQPYSLEFCEVQVFAHEVEEAGIDGQLTCPSRWYNNTPVTLRCEVNKTSESTRCGYQTLNRTYFTLQGKPGDSSECVIVNDGFTDCRTTSTQPGPVGSCWCEQNSTHYSFVYRLTAIAGQHDGFWYCRKQCVTTDFIYGLHMKYHVECLGVRVIDNATSITTSTTEGLVVEDDSIQPGRTPDDDSPRPGVRPGVRPDDDSSTPGNKPDDNSKKPGGTATGASNALVIGLSVPAAICAVMAAFGFGLFWKRRSEGQHNAPLAKTKAPPANAPSSHAGQFFGDKTVHESLDSELDDSSVAESETSEGLETSLESQV
ncbi:uncharacterized protein [Littorina saxatilis]|uniref:uncharacterized protein n=1 Tax=Littorina saxatilis TaxID=31220 RepID=UPI0038B57831